MAPHFSFVCKWVDFWIGFYWSRRDRTLYVLPIPCVGVAVTFGQRATAARMKAVASALEDRVVEDAICNLDDVKLALDRCARLRGFEVERVEVGRTLSDTFEVRAELRGWGDVCDMSLEIPAGRRA
jgi:hypothetical protein